MRDERGAAVLHAQRASRQLAALGPVIVAGRPFPEVVQQLLAARGSLDSLLLRLVEIEVHDCVPTSNARREVDELLRTALGRNAPFRRVTRQPRHPITARSNTTFQGRTSP